MATARSQTLPDQVGPKLPAVHWRTFGDYDRDDRLDLFVPAYVDLDLAKLPQSPPILAKTVMRAQFLPVRGQPVMWARGLPGAKTVFHQKSDGTLRTLRKIRRQ
jgi:hypothetical protein